MTVENTAVAVKKQSFTPEELQLIKNTVAKDATDAELRLFLYTANLRGLNPLTKQIHYVKRGGQGTIQTGIDGFRLIAERTGRYVPSAKPTAFEYDSKGNLVRATVWGMKILNGQAFEFSATAKFSEYAQSFNGVLGTMWKKMPEAMISKCAEALMLRRGFAEELSGLYTHEEMAQADGEETVNVIVVAHQEPVSPSTETTPQTDTPTQEIEQEVEVMEAPIEAVASELEPVFENLLSWCPTHQVEWRTNKFGKRSHINEDKTWCNFNDMIKPLVKEIVDKTLKVDAAGFNDWLKEHYDGRTWSKIEEEEQVAILALLKKG